MLMIIIAKMRSMEEQHATVESPPVASTTLTPDAAGSLMTSSLPRCCTMHPLSPSVTTATSQRCASQARADSA